jgi:hypothetical protein
MNKKGITIKALGGVMFALSLCSSIQAQSSVYVSGTGSDANPCTRTLPCRNFQRGPDAVAAEGEVVALDSAEYGAVIISKGLTITGDGVMAGINVASGDAITIATSGITVSLRSLSIQGGRNGITGINVTSVGTLHVESCVVSGFTGAGIVVNLAEDGSHIFIKDTISRNNGTYGIRINTSTGRVRASIDNCRAERNGSHGFFISENSRVTINRSVASGTVTSGSVGFQASSVVPGSSVEMSCVECVSNNNFFGFNVSAVASGKAMIRGSHSTATNNINYGFSNLGSGVFKSLGNNLVDGNGTDTSGTITVIPAK